MLRADSSTDSNTMEDSENGIDRENKYPEGMLKNIFLLSAGWCFGISATFAQISTTTLAAADLNGAGTSTVPLGTLLASAALSAGIVPFLTTRFGTKLIYLVGAFSAFLGGLLSFVALWSFDGEVAFSLLVIGSIPQGFSNACTNNFRFAATQFATKRFVPTAVSIVIGGGIFGAFLGPELTKWTREAMSVEYAGAYIQIMVLYAALFFVISAVDFKSIEKKKATDSDAKPKLGHDLEHAESQKDIQKGPRPLKEIILQRKVVSIVTLQTISYSSMAALMAATPLSMKEDGFNFDESTTAITSHMLGMFVPSLVSGIIISKFGRFPVMLFGFLTLLLGSLLFLVDRSLAIYISAITVVGIGWNFSFIPATAIFTSYYTDEEKGGIQGFNDFVVLTAVGIFVACSGLIFNATGWDNMSIIFSVYTGIAVLISAYELRRHS